MTYYLMHDQPTTCPVCGARTDIIGNLYHTLLKMQVNECMNIHCQNIFCEIDDE